MEEPKKEERFSSSLAASPHSVAQNSTFPHAHRACNHRSSAKGRLEKQEWEDGNEWRRA